MKIDRKCRQTADGIVRLSCEVCLSVDGYVVNFQFTTFNMSALRYFTTVQKE